MNRKNKLLKALLSALLTLSLILGAIPFPSLTMEVHADPVIVQSGSCGDGVTYTLTDAGLLTISGTGEMTSHPWVAEDISGTVKKVVINNGVSSIDMQAFRSCSNITSIDIPDSVSSIGERAFWCCYGIQEIIVSAGNSYYSSEDGVLFSKDKKKLIKFPCDSEGNYTILSGVTDIDDYAFESCSGLTGITIPDSVSSIGINAFSGCSGLTGITIPDGVTGIGDGAFSGCSGLKGITIPDGVTSIGDYTFSGCSGLTDITLPDGLNNIGQSAFSSCRGLTGITIPDGVTGIGDGAFSGCSGLTGITIPDGVSSIGNDVFWGCSCLTGITLPDALTSIGDRAFSGCSGLTDITIPDGVTGIGVDAFSNCSGLTGIMLPDDLISIGNSAFSNCSGLTSIMIPDSVTSIGMFAFYGCSGLKDITLPISVTNIEEGAFYGCSELKKVYYEGTDDQWDAITMGVSNDCLTGAAIQYGNVPVIMITLSAETIGLKYGDTSDLTAAVFPSYAGNKNVTWESSDPSVATVVNGRVTAKASGVAVITAGAVNGNTTATCTVTVQAIPVNGVTLDKAKLDLRPGETGSLTATVAPDNASYKNVTWESSNTSVATVADGAVTAAAPGEAVITVRTVSGNKTATCNVTVTEVKLTGIALDKSEAELAEGEKLTLTVSFTPADAANKNVTWSSSDETVATVAGGEVTAVKAGKAVIKAVAADGGYEAKCEITVKGKVTDPEPQTPDEQESPLGPDKPDLSQYTASGNEIAVKSVNLKKTIFKDVKGIKNFGVVVGDTDAVKIKGSTLTVLKSGTVTVAAFDKNSGKLEEKTITLIAPVIETSAPTEINRRGNLDLNRYISSTVKPAKWKSSNKKIAEISDDGLLTIKKSGTVKITVTFPAEKGMTAKKLTIKLKIAMPQFKKTTYTVKTGKTVATAVKNAAASDITYRIEDQTIATVDTAGKVTGVGKGTTRLIMTVKGIDYETKIKVK